MPRITADVLLHPHPMLRKRCAPVREVDGEVLAIIEKMVNALSASQGVAIAAPQLGHALRIVALRQGDSVRIFVNPAIASTAGDEQPVREGCLSFPGVFIDVPRYPEVTVKYNGVDGKVKTLTATGTEAQALQHEIEHLDGVLLIDYARGVKREMMLRHARARAKRADATVMRYEADVAEQPADAA